MKSFKIKSVVKPAVEPLADFGEIEETKKLSRTEFLKAIAKPVEIEEFDFDGGVGPGSEMQRPSGELRSSADLKQDGLVFLAQPVTQQKVSKYIEKMKASTAERAKFQELMQLKFYEKEKDELKKELGAEPVVFVTPGYKKALGDAKAFAQRLEAEEPSSRNINNLFRHMLDGSSQSATPAPAEAKVIEEEPLPEVEEDHVWKKLLPGVDASLPIPGTLEFSAAEAKRGAQKIVDEIHELAKSAESREAKIAAAKERLLARRKKN